MQMLNKVIVSLLPLMPRSFVRVFSKRYIAGKTLEKGLEVSRALNRAGCLVTLDLLGEEVDRPQDARASMNECMRILDGLGENQIEGSLSLKLTSLGLKFDRASAHSMVRDIVAYSKRLGRFVRIDMENSPYTDDTLMIYRKLRRDFDNVGTVIQAYLKRSEDDVRNLISENIANLRLCKGIYNEKAEIAYKEKEQIRNSFRKLIDLMADAGTFTGVATHDEPMIEHTLKRAKEGGFSQNRFELQMLLGVTENSRKRLVENGNRMRVYVPYGEKWYQYSIRRLKENPQLAGHILHNLFSRG